MSDILDFKDLQLDFFKEETPKVEIQQYIETYKLMIADDDKEVHMITKMILKDFTFEDRKLTFIHAYTGEETKKLLEEHPDTAILFLDVVMESHHSGLDVVSYLRDTLKNDMTRIVLRTGQPGEAPEEEVIKQYDINDYRLKTELTVKRMHTTLYTALRNYRDLQRLQRHKKGLERIIQASSQLFQQNQFSDFLTSVLTELSNFYQDYPGMIYMRESAEGNRSAGFITMEQSRKVKIVAATGKYEGLIGREISSVPELEFMSTVEISDHVNSYGIESVAGGFIIKSSSEQYINNYIYIEGAQGIHDFDLIELFLKHYGTSFDTYLAKNLFIESQQKMLDVYRSVVERQFEKPLEHISKFSKLVRCCAKKYGYSDMQSDLMGHAASLHDVGMVKLPDHVLMRQANLTPEEYESVKKHTDWGYEMLRLQDDEIFKVAAEIALNHHEHYDGSGYPKGMSGAMIPESARIASIVDVYVSMTSDKVYGRCHSSEDAIAYLNSGKGIQFDPGILKAFLECLED